MSSQFRAVVFDLDGLMFNTEELYEYVGGEVLRRRGKTFPDELINQMMGRKNEVALQVMIDWHELEDTVDQLSAESETIFQEILDDRLQMMPGLPELLSALEKAEIPKGIATGSRQRFALDVLGRFELERRFRFILTSDDIGQGKPHPEIYETAAGRHGVNPEEMLVFEDSELGCRAALAAGAFAVAVPSGQSHSHNFQGVQVIADTLADRQIYELLGLSPESRMSNAS